MLPIIEIVNSTSTQFTQTFTTNSTTIYTNLSQALFDSSNSSLSSTMIYLFPLAMVIGFISITKKFVMGIIVGNFTMLFGVWMGLYPLWLMLPTVGLTALYFYYGINYETGYNEYGDRYIERRWTGMNNFDSREQEAFESELNDMYMYFKKDV